MFPLPPPAGYRKSRSCHTLAVVRHHRHGSNLDVVAQPRDRVGGGGLTGRNGRAVVEHRVRGEIAGNPREGDLTECGEGIKGRGDRWQHVWYRILGLAEPTEGAVTAKRHYILLVHYMRV